MHLETLDWKKDRMKRQQNRTQVPDSLAISPPDPRRHSKQLGFGLKFDFTQGAKRK